MSHCRGWRLEGARHVGNDFVAEPGALPDPLVERPQLRLVIHVVQAEHRRHVLDRRKALDGTARDALRRGVKRYELGVVLLEPLELVQQLVELLIGDLGVVVDVVAFFVVANGFAELANAVGGRLHRSREST